MFRSIIKSSVTILLIGLVACQSVSEQHANAKPLLSAAENKLATLKLEFTDTTSPEAQQIIKGLDSFYNIQVRNGFNGSVLVGYKGKVLYERYYGVCNKSTGVELCGESPSQLASTSKPFTATAILWLHQNKYLNIDDKVSKYIEDFPYKDVTVKMLLNHRSGIPDYLNFATKYWSHSKNMTNQDLIEIFKKYKPRLNSRSNTRFEYSNSNYAILAVVLEQVTKLPYPQFMKEFIFEPLGLKNTFVYDPLGFKPEKIAISYKANWQIDPDMFADGIYGDKGIYSTVEDLYRWDRSFYNHILLNEKTLQMAYSGYSFERPGIKNYGLGWRMNIYPDGRKVVFHNGWWHGNNTVFYRFIQDDFTIIVLGNRYNTRIYSHSKAVYDIVKNNSEADMVWEESGSPTD